MFKPRKRQQSIKLEFQCTACGRAFKQSVGRLFVDLDTFERN
jgi:ribosomal protein L44E